MHFQFIYTGKCEGNLSLANNLSFPQTPNFSCTKNYHARHSDDISYISQQRDAHFKYVIDARSLSSYFDHMHQI